MRHFTCHLHEVIPFQALISIGFLTMHGLGLSQSESFLFSKLKSTITGKSFLAVSTIIKTVMLLNHPVK